MSEQITEGSIWRRRKTGALVQIIRLVNCASEERPYFDIGWETVERPVRRVQSYQVYWLRNCELVRDTASTTTTEGESK